MSRKGRKFLIMWIYIVLYTVGMLMDGLFTYWGTPDLGLEANPLVSDFGLGWAALGIANLIIWVLYILLLYFSFVRYRPPLIEADSFRAYRYMLIYQDPKAGFFTPPWRVKNWKAFWALGGNVLGPALIAARIAIVWDWAVYLWDIPADWYWTMYDWVPYGRVNVLALFLVFIIAYYLYFWTEYRQNEIRRRETE